MTKVTDALGTSYLTANYVSAVRKLVEQGDVDLAGARIFRDVMEVLISEAYGGHVIRDTADADRDAYLQECYQRGESNREYSASPNRTTLSIPAAMDSVIPYIAALKPDMIYRVVNGNVLSAQAYIALVQAYRPKIQINPEHWAKDILTYVHRRLLPTSFRWEEFYVVTGSTFVIEKVGDRNYLDFLNSNVAVPTVFGSVYLANLPEWQHFLKRVSDDLRSALTRRETKHISDYLGR